MVTWPYTGLLGALPNLRLLAEMWLLPQEVVQLKLDQPTVLVATALHNWKFHQETMEIIITKLAGKPIVTTAFEKTMEAKSGSHLSRTVALSACTTSLKLLRAKVTYLLWCQRGLNSKSKCF